MTEVPYHGRSSSRTIAIVACASSVALIVSGASAAARPSVGAGSRTGIEGAYSMSASKAEVNAAPRHEPGANDNWGSFRLELRLGHFRLTDRRPAGALVQGTNSGWTTGRYVVSGSRLKFIPQAGAGDTPLGREGNGPVICRWSLYRSALTFHLVANAADPGPPSLFVKPWRRASS